MHNPRLARVASQALAAASVAALLAGCVTVPNSGRAQGAEPTTTRAVQNVPGEARIEAAPPMTGEQPEALVKDFYDAMVDFQNEHAVARQYLVNGAAAPWATAPARVVVVEPVDDGEPHLAAPPTQTTATYNLTFRRVGEVLADGHFVAATGDPRDVLPDTIEVVRDPKSKNEWRISKAPDALRLTVADFKTVFHEATLYFPRIGRDPALIADRRWFPVPLAELPNEVAKAYVQGPSASLAPGVSVEALLPADSTALLATQGAGQAKLDFKVQGDLEPSAHTQLRDAVRATFSDTALLVNSLTLTVNGTPEQWLLEAPSDDPPTKSVVDAWFIDGHHVLRSWVTAAFDGAVVTAPLGGFDVTGMTRVSLAPTAAFAAGTYVQDDTTLGLRIVDRAGDSHRVPLGASKLSSFTWNADGSGVWIAGAVNEAPAAWFVTVTVSGEGASSSYIVQPFAQRVTLDPELTRSGGALVELRPSPDAVRVSAIVSNPKLKLSELFVGRLDKTRSAPAVMGFQRVAPVLDPPTTAKGGSAFNVLRALWVDGSGLVVVARRGGAAYSLWDASPDGSAVTARNTSGLPDINESTTFTLGRDSRMLALVTQQKKRTVLELNDAGWVAVPPRPDGAKILSVLYAG